MNCETVSLMLNAVLDGELSAAERAAVDQHLDECHSCREQFTDLRNLDATLKRTLRPAAIDAVIERVLESIGNKSGVRHPNSLAEGQVTRGVSEDERQVTRGVSEDEHQSQLFPARSHVEWSRKPTASTRGTAAVAISLLICVLAIAAGIVLKLPEETHAVAEITMSTGSIDVRRSSTAKWTLVEGPSIVSLPAHARIRTRDKSLCEIRTKSDALVRLNHETELVLHRPEQIELVAGELWCRTPSTASLEIRTANTSRQARPDAVFTCPSSCETQWQASPDQELRCTGVSASPIKLKANLPQANCTVKPGETLTFTADSVPATSGHADRLQALTWQLPLLILRSPSDSELRQRLTELLAAAGRSKMSYLYDEQIRQLGAPGTLPLIAFVRSSESTGQPDLRYGAMNIIADLAPPSTVADLEALLGDDDFVVRRLATRALHRLLPDRKFEIE